MIEALLVVIVVILAVGVALAAASVRVLREYERAVVFRLGRLIDARRARASCCSCRRSTAWCASRCAPSRSTSRRRT